MVSKIDQAAREIHIRNGERCSSCGEGGSLVIRKSTKANGVIAYKWQCFDCGSFSGGELPYDMVKEWGDLDEIPDADFEYMTMRRIERQEAYQIEKEDLWEKNNDAWWANYNTYMRSAVWAAKRSRVWERDGYLCQACRLNSADQVHHLTYDHLGNEPLFDLVSVCTSCHDEITTMDRLKRAGEKYIAGRNHKAI